MAIVIKVESGVSVGFPRKWSGQVVGTINLSPSDTVESFLFQVRSLPGVSRSVTVESLHLGSFKPTAANLKDTVGALGLKSGTIQVWNGMVD